MRETEHLRRSTGASIAIHRFGGPVDAPAFLWLHANGCASRSYAPLLTRLAKHLRVFAFDLPGQGESGRDAEHLSLDALAITARTVLLHLLAATDGALPYVGGHSLGAVPWLLNPDLAVAGAVLVEAAIFPPRDHPVRAEADRLTRERVERIPRRRALFRDPAALASTLAALPAFAGLDEEALAIHCAAVLEKVAEDEWRLRCDPAMEARMYAEIADPAPYNALASWHVPTLVVAADARHLGASWATRMQPTICAALPNARLVVVPETGHMLPLEAPQACADAVRNWLQRTS